MLFWSMAKIEVKTRCNEELQYFVWWTSPYSLGNGKHEMLLWPCSQLCCCLQCPHVCNHQPLLIHWYDFLSTMKNKPLKKINTLLIKTWCVKDFVSRNIYPLLSINSKTSVIRKILSVKNVLVFANEVFIDKQNA